jgi:hypothetical protein
MLSCYIRKEPAGAGEWEVHIECVARFDFVARILAVLDVCAISQRVQ